MQSITAESATYEDNRESNRMYYSQAYQPIEPTLQLQNSKFHKWQPISDSSDDASLRYAAISQPQYDIHIRNYADVDDDNAYVHDG